MCAYSLANSDTFDKQAYIEQAMHYEEDVHYG